MIRSGRLLGLDKGCADNVGSCLHELLGGDPPRRLGWDIGCHTTGKSPSRDRAGESGVFWAPQSRVDRWGSPKQEIATS